MGVMKMGTIVPRAGLKPTSRAFWASVLTITPRRLLMSPLYPHKPVDAAPFASEACADFYTHTHTYIYTYINPSTRWNNKVIVLNVIL